MAQAGDKEERDKLICENTKLIWSVVKRFANRGYDMQDLFQMGCIGLIKAIDRFDTGFNVMFSTYAVPMITGEIMRYIRDDGIIKISRSIKENIYKVVKAREEIYNEIGRDATVEELAERAGISIEDVITAHEATCEVETIYKPVYRSDDSEMLLVDKLKSKRDDNEKLFEELMVKEMMNTLSDNEKKLISMRYFMDKTQKEIAAEFKTSQVQISRMEKKIIMKLRKEWA